MNISDYYFHAILKDNREDEIYNNFETILKDRKLKARKYLNNTEKKFNGLEYVSLASFVNSSIYKVFVMDENNYNVSQLSNLYNSYNDYLNYLKLDNWLEEPLSKEEFFKKNNTNKKRDYFNYLDSVSRTYPVDIKYLYESTNDIVYKHILDIINNDILYCNKTENCFEEYINNSKGIKLIFPKTIAATEVKVIPNLPCKVESILVERVQNLQNRYSNQIGEVQVKDYLDIKNVVGIIIGDNIEQKIIYDLLKRYNLDVKIYKLVDYELIEL